MGDLVSSVLAVPAYVEGFVKTARVVIKYKSISEDHVETVEDAMFCAETLKYYAGFVNIKDENILNHPSAPLLEEALLHAKTALETAERILHDWTVKLKLYPKSQGRMILDKLASSIAEKFAQSKSDGSGGDRRKNPLSRIKLLQEASYLAFGVIEIKDAMKRLNKWITRLEHLLLTSPNLRLRTEIVDSDNSHGDKQDDVAFVAAARKRAKSEIPVTTIDAAALESAFDIDPSHNSGIHRLEDGDYSGCIVDLRDIQIRPFTPDMMEEQRDTLNICRLFAEAPSDSEYRTRATVGILPCLGYAIANAGKNHYLFFRLPSGTGTPRTLRSLLLSGPAAHSINARLDFCIKLATSVLIVQSLGLVHKNIRSDAILVTTPLSTLRDNKTLGTPYLISFGQARLSAGPSDLRTYAGASLAMNLYIHPRHLISYKRKKFQMRDDIYSLGICLLEVAIWRSLLIWDSENDGFVFDHSVVDLSDDHYEEILESRGHSTQHDKSWLRRFDLMEFVQKTVPITMGDTLKDIILNCLTFGEHDTPSYDATFDVIQETDTQDDRADQQSVMFVQDILTKLRSLSFADTEKTG
ncbi:uncharacterized protein FOMMEDRAFT_160228 [Fomitiporia mediterranea MF3/22]|uniref:uncharacterized protein n=1 Tax=Fomitiporia mediterranea (strain MF3/22) TaxID=694068 RepID=UPI0004408A12|nr:uncharacterized protein FOMMEDRAFT_160228 [Fomitiporia mediterranea MF3/22]EJC99787.1 hypothetical protein FOMMEDRAFT_160228 [Fomitiporia mediterranea MF3/22]